jgi:hypothetical protein
MIFVSTKYGESTADIALWLNRGEFAMGQQAPVVKVGRPLPRRAQHHRLNQFHRFYQLEGFRTIFHQKLTRTQWYEFDIWCRVVASRLLRGAYPRGVQSADPGLAMTR